MTHPRPGDAVVVNVSSKLLLGVGLQRVMRELVEAGANRILLDLADVADINNAGVGELAAAYVSLAKVAGSIALMHVNNRVKGMLQTAGLCDVLTIYRDEASAARSGPAARYDFEQCARSEVYIG